MSSYFRQWAAYRKAFTLSNEIDELVTTFPPEERYRLTDQICRSSSSVCANLGESFGKRRYPKHFVAKITDALSENYETQVWLDKALTRGYLTREQYDYFQSLSNEVAKLLHWMENNPTRFTYREKK